MDFQGEGKTSMRMLWESYKPTLSPGNRHRNPVLTDYNSDNIYDTLDFSRLILIADRGICNYMNLLHVTDAGNGR